MPAHDLSPDDFEELYFRRAKPVVITGVTDGWPCRQWTIESLMERVGDNKVFIRGKTNQEDYRVGKAYSIRKDTFRNYCKDLLAGNSRAKSSYLAVASLQQAFPQLLEDVPLPDYLTHNGKLHLGPYMWVALKGHYEFCHFDPDDNFLFMVTGKKQVRLFGLYSIECLYPNPLGSHGKTIQSQVNLDQPDLERFPLFSRAKCQHCILHPGEMLFIPAFYWHQVTALDSGISCNMFYGDSGKHKFLSKILEPPYKSHFTYWLLNIIEQNRTCDSFPRLLARLPEALFHFFVKQWHEEADNEQLDRLVETIKSHCKIDSLPERQDDAKFPPILKIRGLLHRDGTISK